jgi:hypothetical protein
MTGGRGWLEKGGFMAVENQTLGQSMIRLFMGYIPTRVIYVTAKLGVADNIAKDGNNAQELSQNSTSRDGRHRE